VAHQRSEANAVNFKELQLLSSCTRLCRRGGRGQVTGPDWKWDFCRLSVIAEGGESVIRFDAEDSK
jgi:hypothetical protein